MGDEVFSSYAFTRQEGTRHGFAEVAECHDLGEDADGSVFTDHPTQVRTWTFDGYSPEEVLGVRTGDDAFAVFIADSVPPDKRDRIGEELSLSTSDGR